MEAILKKICLYSDIVQANPNPNPYPSVGCCHFLCISSALVAQFGSFSTFYLP
jgi:hypothetical protein